MKKYPSVDLYIADQIPTLRPALKKMRQVIKKAAPKAEEAISYGMPGYKYYGMLAFFGAFKNHYSFFSPPRVLDLFRKELGKYKTTKSAINIPLDSPVPEKLITRIVKTGVKVNYEIAREKGKIKKRDANKKSGK
jgi:uncharacterized protein YdhG (YjbR/CyaY superfamily)